MDALELLAQLEGIRDKIPAVLQQDFEDLLVRIRSTYEMSIKYVTPPEPVHDGRRNLAAHQSTLEGLCTQLGNSLEAFQQIYVGKGSDTYHAKATESLQDLQMLRDHLAQASLLHTTLATNFETATEAKLALVALLVGLGITLSVLIGSAGTTAPVTVPAAALEVAGGLVSIGLMTEAELAATAAIMGLLWAALPNALLAGTGAFIGAEMLEHVALHPPTTVSLPTTHSNVPTNNGPKITINEVRAHQEDLPMGGDRSYIPPKSGRGQPVWNAEKGGFLDANGNVWVWAPAGAQHGGPHWDVQHANKKHTNIVPNGKVIGGPTKDNFPNKGR